MLLFASCAQQTVLSPAAPAENQPPVGEQAVPPVQEAPPAAQPASGETPVGDINPDVVKLFGRVSAVKSYSFTFAKLPDERAGNTYFVKGSKIRVDVLPELSPGNNIEVVFLDTTDKSAYGYCVTASICPDPNKATKLNYDDWIVPLPPSWTTQVQYGKIVGTLTYQDRPVTEVRYVLGGKYYEAYVDNYYGFPLRVAIASDQDFTDIVGGSEYTAIAFNTVSDSQVVHVDVST